LIADASSPLDEIVSPLDMDIPTLVCSAEGEGAADTSNDDLLSSCPSPKAALEDRKASSSTRPSSFDHARKVASLDAGPSSYRDKASPSFH